MVDARRAFARWRLPLWFALCVTWGAVVGLTVPFVLGILLLPSFALLAGVAQRRHVGRPTLLALLCGYETAVAAVTIAGLLSSSWAEWLSGGWLLSRLEMAAFGALVMLLGLRYVARE
jgi:hypothetical protein